MNLKKNKKVILLPPAIGDWTTFKPTPDEQVKPRHVIRGADKLTEKELMEADLLFIELIEKYLGSMQKNLDFPLVLQNSSLELLAYVDILKEIDVPVAQFKIESSGTAPLFACFDSNLSNAVINHAVGGYSEFASTKSLTEIEENILEIAVSFGAEIMLYDMAGDVSVNFVNSPNVYFDQSISETSVFAFIKSEIGFGQKAKGAMFLMAPIKLLQAMLQKKKESRAEIDFGRLPPGIAGSLKTDVSAFLGKTNISAKELYELEVGDVIVLDSSIHNLLPVEVGHGLQLLGQPGIKNDRICLKILSGGGRVEKIKLSPAIGIAPVDEPIVEEEQEDHSEDTQEIASEEMFDEDSLIDGDETTEDLSEDVEGDEEDEHDEGENDDEPFDKLRAEDEEK